MFRAIQRYERNWMQVHVNVFPKVAPASLRAMYYKVLRENPELNNEFPLDADVFSILIETGSDSKAPRLNR